MHIQSAADELFRRLMDIALWSYVGQYSGRRDVRCLSWILGLWTVLRWVYRTIARDNGNARALHISVRRSRPPPPATPAAARTHSGCYERVYAYADTGGQWRPSPTQTQQQVTWVA